MGLSLAPVFPYQFQHTTSLDACYIAQTPISPNVYTITDGEPLYEIKVNVNQLRLHLLDDRVCDKSCTAIALRFNVDPLNCNHHSIELRGQYGI